MGDKLGSDLRAEIATLKTEIVKAAASSSQIAGAPEGAVSKDLVESGLAKLGSDLRDEIKTLKNDMAETATTAELTDAKINGVANGLEKLNTEMREELQSLQDDIAEAATASELTDVKTTVVSGIEKLGSDFRE